MSITTGEAFASVLHHNWAKRETRSDFDLHGETEALLASIGTSTADSGGALSFYGRDPIVPSTLRGAP